LINIDLPWNPAVLEQRIGRIYRLGQKKHINVFNFISKSSIEHRILYLLDFKKSVFTGVIEEEGKDEVMLEGFLDSVRALTEIDTETFIGNSSINPLPQNPEVESINCNPAKDPDDTDHLIKTEDNRQSENQEPVADINADGSLFKNLENYLKPLQ
jgi:spore cortex formation protein SpoVR/YcgB (stage V sporulation)